MIKSKKVIVSTILVVFMHVFVVTQLVGQQAAIDALREQAALEVKRIEESAVSQNSILKGETARQIREIKAQVEQKIAQVRNDAEQMTAQLKQEIEAKAFQLKYNAEKEKLIIMSQAEQRALELRAEEQRRQLEEKFQKNITLDSKMTSFGTKNFSFDLSSMARVPELLPVRSTGQSQEVSAEWRNKISKDFYNDMSFMKSIITEGETIDQVDDFAQRFKKQNLWFDQTLSSTRSMADQSYKQLLDKQATLQSIVQAQKKADLFLDKMSAKIALSDAQKKKARLTILYDINERIQQEREKTGSLERPVDLDQETVNTLSQRALEEYSLQFKAINADLSDVEMKESKTVHVVPVMVQKLQGELDQIKAELESTRNTLEKMRMDKTELKNKMTKEIKTKTEEWLDLEIQLRQERGNLKHAQQEMTAALKRMEQSVTEKEVLHAQLKAKAQENDTLRETLKKSEENVGQILDQAGQAKERAYQAEERARLAEERARLAQERVKEVEEDADEEAQALEDDIAQANQQAREAIKRAELAEKRTEDVATKAQEQQERSQRQQERDKKEAAEQRKAAIEDTKQLLVPHIEEERQRRLELKIQLEQAIQQAQKFEKKAGQLEVEVRSMQDRVSQARKDADQARVLVKEQATLRQEAEKHKVLVEELAGQMIESINVYLEQERSAHKAREAQLMDKASVLKFKKISLTDEKRELQELQEESARALEEREKHKQAVEERLRLAQDNLESLEEENANLQAESLERGQLEDVRERVNQEREHLSAAQEELHKTRQQLEQERKLVEQRKGQLVQKQEQMFQKQSQILQEQERVAQERAQINRERESARRRRAELAAKAHDEVLPMEPEDSKILAMIPEKSGNEDISDELERDQEEEAMSSSALEVVQNQEEETIATTE
ncbi:hypothetical protein K2X40_03330 [Candidatus Babeliales bacterium]|nr:hypothetical protein [Candidatus Babeliales bacterium]MBY0353150.1 hypothetical protein [Candidatus Babeliales bacterium]